jgi:hypothetical protein
MPLNYLDSNRGSQISRSINELTTRIQGNPILIGTITYGDLNDGASALSVDFTYTDGKQAGKYIANIFCKNTATFVSYSTSATIDKIELIDNSVLLGVTTIGQYYPAKVMDDLSVKVTLSETNPKDWTAGEIEVYATFIDYPNI